jgi:hypothetical protein
VLKATSQVWAEPAHGGVAGGEGDAVGVLTPTWLWAIARRNSPTASGEAASTGPTARRLAEDRYVVGVAAEPSDRREPTPSAAIRSRKPLAADPANSSPWPARSKKPSTSMR